MADERCSVITCHLALEGARGTVDGALGATVVPVWDQVMLRQWLFFLFVGVMLTPGGAR
jgi:hypothetical protein